MLIIVAAGVIIVALLLFGAACHSAGFVFAALLRSWTKKD